MTEGASALQLVLGGDPALYSIVALSLTVSLSAAWISISSRSISARWSTRCA